MSTGFQTNRFIGWVKRSETHHATSLGTMGSASSTHPTGGAGNNGLIGWVKRSETHQAAQPGIYLLLSHAKAPRRQGANKEKLGVLASWREAIHSVTERTMGSAKLHPSYEMVFGGAA